MKNIYAAAIVVLLLSANTAFGQLSREIIAFKELDVTDKINVKLIPSTENKIIIEGELANQMELTQYNDVLRLEMNSSYILKGDKVNATVYSSNVSSIIARKGAVVKSSETEIQGKLIYLLANEGAKIQVRLHADQIDVNSTTGALIQTEGEAKSQTVNCTFGGSYNGKNLLTESAIARTNAGGKIELNTDKSVDVQTRAGGIIDIYGNPKDRKTKRLAGGKINFLN